MSFFDDISGIFDTVGDVFSTVEKGVEIGSSLGLIKKQPAPSVAPIQTGGNVPFVAGQTDRDTLLQIAGRSNTLSVQTDHPVLDVLTSAQPEDLAFARALHQKGIILAQSDAGALLYDRGQTPRKFRVKLIDGRSVSVLGFPTVGGAKRRKINYAAPAKIRDSARTMRALHRHVDTFKKIGREGARLDKKVNPKAKRGACVAVKKTTCRKKR